MPQLLPFQNVDYLQDLFRLINLSCFTWPSLAPYTRDMPLDPFKLVPGSPYINVTNLYHLPIPSSFWRLRGGRRDGRRPPATSSLAWPLSHQNDAHPKVFTTSPLKDSSDIFSCLAQFVCGGTCFTKCHFSRPAKRTADRALSDYIFDYFWNHLQVPRHHCLHGRAPRRNT